VSPNKNIVLTLMSDAPFLQYKVPYMVRYIELTQPYVLRVARTRVFNHIIR